MNPRGIWATFLRIVYALFSHFKSHLEINHFDNKKSKRGKRCWWRNLWKGLWAQIMESRGKALKKITYTLLKKINKNFRKIKKITITKSRKTQKSKKSRTSLFQVLYPSNGILGKNVLLRRCLTTTSLYFARNLFWWIEKKNYTTPIYSIFNPFNNNFGHLLGRVSSDKAVKNALEILGGR